jgi:diaminohydroxyphosphoribosylaminopyrimidine deaminase/5-amino-6-(5-phosphoribosylamino)uracil reductase
VWFRAGMMIGGDGVPVAVAFGVDRLDDAPSFMRQSVEPCGDDVVETWALPA